MLRPGGRYGFNVWDTWEENAFARITHETVETFFPDDPPGFYRVPFSYNDPDTIREAVGEAGFTDISLTHVPVTSRIPDASRFAQGLVFGNPLIDEIVDRGADPNPIRDAVSAALARELGAKMRIRALVVEASVP